MKSTKQDFRIMSSKKCITCGKLLKQNLIDKNPDADQCFKCYKPKPAAPIEEEIKVCELFVIKRTALKYDDANIQSTKSIH